MSIRSVRVKRDDVIAKINEHIKAILDRYAKFLATYDKEMTAWPTKESIYKQDLAAWHRRVADALDGTSKDVVKFPDSNGSYAQTLSLWSRARKHVPMPIRPTKPVKPASPDDDEHLTYDTRTLRQLRAQHALLSATVDETITVGANDYGVLFTTTPGQLRW